MARIQGDRLDAPDDNATAREAAPEKQTGSAVRRGAAPVPRASQEAHLSAFIRAENEDDDGYDPYSDRPPAREPLFERDPWN